MLYIFALVLKEVKYRALVNELLYCYQSCLFLKYTECLYQNKRIL